MKDVARHPFLTTRNGSSNYYYKRGIPMELRDVAARATGRATAAQIWKSLGTSNRRDAERLYAAEHHRVEQTFAEWRSQSLGAVAQPVARHETKPLTAALTRSIIETWKSELVETDFRARAELWQAAQADPDALMRGSLMAYSPRDPDPFELLLDEDTELRSFFLCALRCQYADRLKDLKLRYQVGDVADQVAKLTEKELGICEQSLQSLARRALLAEIEVLEAHIKDLPLIIEAPDAPIAEPNAKTTVGTAHHAAAALMSALVERYIKEEGRLKDWCRKDELRWRAILHEWIEIIGDKPVSGYQASNGADYRTVQVSLPARRGVRPFKGCSARKCAEIAERSDPDRSKFKRLSANTIKDKVGCLRRFFDWAKSIDASVVNPVDSVKIERPKKRNRVKPRSTWSIDELNRMFSTPIYTGCRSPARWKDPGTFKMLDKAEYWAPLIGLFSGLRLGEIIQMHSADIHEDGDLHYFSVTTAVSTLRSDADLKSIKTASGHRNVPIHQTLVDYGFLELVKQRRNAGQVRLFPEFRKSLDDDSWSKAFSKHFARFRRTFEVRPDVSFHSLRHNFEDALRNEARAAEDVRDAIMGHAGSGSVGRQYGDGYTVATLNRTIQAVAYPGLILPLRDPLNSSPV